MPPTHPHHTHSVPPGVADLSPSKELDVPVLVVLETLQCDLQLLQGEGLFVLRLEVIYRDNEGEVVVRDRQKLELGLKSS